MRARRGHSRRQRPHGEKTLGAALVGLVLVLPSCATAQPFQWSGPGTTAADVARLFEAVCLANRPDFLAAGAMLDASGFQQVSKSLTRVHPDRGVAAVVVPAGDPQAQDIRSCSILAEGLEPYAALAAVEPVIARHLPPALGYRTTATPSHTVWSDRTEQGEVRVIASDVEGAAYLGIMVDPRAGGGQG